MKRSGASHLAVLASASLLLLARTAVAHGDDEAPGHMDMGTGATPDVKPDASSYPPTYFSLPEHQGVVWGHICLMVIAWVVLLPLAVMLSLARSRYALLPQVAFVATNAFGVMLGSIYNASTPDLYPNNAHHKIGWIATSAVTLQLVIALLARVAGTLKGRAGTAGELRPFIPVSAANMAEHQRMNDSRFPKLHRISHDSGQGTEPNTESLRAQSVSSSSGAEEAPIRMQNVRKEEDDDDQDLESIPLGPRQRKVPGGIAAKLASFISTKAWRFLIFTYNSIDRSILILGFIAICTGIITYARFFEGHGIFTGLAHWIKGGIFFWLGIFTLGRWSGSFGELGWAWNVRPKKVGQKWRPTAEFVESGLIFFYGSTNIFLEHLGNWGSEYSAQDLEHISITVLFIGGGLCGMLIESTRIRDLLNTTVTEAALEHPDHAYPAAEQDAVEAPDNYEFSLNPIPALVILLLGIMMSSHTQTSMISSMVHKQWGNLLTGASFARGFTYVLMYLKPPRSVLPSRPPTELLTSFGLIAGGIIFMASSSDTIDGMIHYDLDAMFMYTVTMGFVGLLMAWVIICIAVKGWAVRKEAGRPSGPYRQA